MYNKFFPLNPSVLFTHLHTLTYDILNHLFSKFDVICWSWYLYWSLIPYRFPWDLYTWIIITLLRHIPRITHEVVRLKGPNINTTYNTTSQFWRQEETEDPKENLREQAWIGKPFSHTARTCSMIWTQDWLVQGKVINHYTTHPPILHRNIHYWAIPHERSIFQIL